MLLKSDICGLQLLTLCDVSVSLSSCRAVWSSKFTSDGLRIMTGSDDFTVRMWDLPTGKGLLALTDAKDYIRAQAPSPSSKHVWCAGSYDRTARVYDLRTKKVLFSLDHGSQIDDVLILPGGVRAVTVGGTDVKVWDFFTGGRLISKLSNHAKAVTSCVVHPSGDRLLTAGLDGQIKVQNLTSFEVSAAMYYPSPIVSLAISHDGKRIGTGSTDGTAEIRVAKGFKEDLPRSAPGGGLKERQFEGWGGGFEKPRREGPRPGSRRYFDRGAFSKADDEDVVVDFKRQGTGASYDRFLRSFSYGKALEAAVKTKDSAIVVSVIEELASRKALRNALVGCSDEAVEEQLQLILRNIDLPAYTARLTQLLNVILDVHGKDFGQGEFADELLNRIFSKVKDEVKIGRQLNRLQGSLAMIMNVASIN